MPHRKQCNGKTLVTWEKKISARIAASSFIIWYNQWPTVARSCLALRNSRVEKDKEERFFCQHLALAIILSTLSLSLHPFWSSTKLFRSFAELTSCCVTQCLYKKVQKKSKCKHKQKSSSKKTLTYTFKQVIYFNYSNVGLCTFPVFATKLQSVNECLISKCMICFITYTTPLLQCLSFSSHHTF